MSTYLERNPQRYQQWRATRRNGAAPSGVIVVHTAENATTFTGADRGADNVAQFITTRSDPGSYHSICDYDSAIRMAPWLAETWHCTATNNHAVGLAAAVRSADWGRLGSRGDRIVVRMALEARAYADWLRTTRGIVIPARIITRAQAVARVPGFIAHGSTDPGRRSDPGAGFNWPLLLAVFADPSLAGSGVTLPSPGSTPPTGTLPHPLTPLRRLEMFLVINPANKQVFLVTETAVTYVGNAEEHRAWSALLGTPTELSAGEITRLQQRAGATRALVAAGVSIPAAVDTKALAEAVGPQLAEAVVASLPDTALTQDDVAAALRSVLRSL